MRATADRPDRLITEDSPTAVEYTVVLALMIVECPTPIGTLEAQANAP